MQKLSFMLLVLMFSGVNMLKAQQPAVVTNNKPGWHKIAEQSVSFKTDRDEIIVLGADKFKAIQLKVTDARIHIEDMDISYDLPGLPDRIKEDVHVRTDFKKGEHSRIIYLQYPCLKLHAVSFVYRTIPNYRYEKAHVEVYGLK